MLSLVSSLIVALSLADAAGPDVAAVSANGADAGAIALDVPYVPQTEALCGGAAVAMVLRYWGETHAGVQEFATLVDRRAHGIVTDRLVDAVRQRQWRADPFGGSIDVLRAELRQRRPVIVLIHDRANRYHYVVVVGATADRVVVHDPAWGPSRQVPLPEFVRLWQATGFWSLVILPKEAPAAGPTVVAQADAPTETHDNCDATLARAVDDIQQRGLTRAEAILGDVQSQCPRSAGPLRELAGVRFAERRWREAARLAERAVAIDPRDEYAWELLASSRFMDDDVAGALQAWNHIGKPRVDTIRIEGLTRTRYALVADALRLPTGSLITAEGFVRAERRLDELPDQSSARLEYRPESDGFGGIDVAIVEPATRPHGAAEWAARAAQAAVDREVIASIPGATGQGEMWSASWRWWSNRPRAAVSFATPHPGALAGVWRVDASWERETYKLAPAAAPVREERAHGGLTISDWATANLRYELAAGMDSWNGTRRAASAGGAIERRAGGDRLSFRAGAAAWMPLTADPGFRTVGILATYRSSTQSRGFVYRASGGIDGVSRAAPLSLWPGAGDGHARTPLLRAHPLLDDGVVVGSVFGRQLAYANGEAQKWVDTSLPVRFAIAGFIDLARASRRQSSASADAFQVDAGAGVRVKAPGQKGTLRIDFAQGLRDGSRAVTVGWQY